MGRTILPSIRQPQRTGIARLSLKQYAKKTLSQWIAFLAGNAWYLPGAGAPPQQFATKEELLEYVANTCRL